MRNLFDHRVEFNLQEWNSTFCQFGSEIKTAADQGQPGDAADRDSPAFAFSNSWLAQSAPHALFTFAGQLAPFG